MNQINRMNQLNQRGSEVLKEVYESCTHSPEPRWQAALALLAVGGLYMALPRQISHTGPRWLLLSIVAALLIPTVITLRLKKHALNQVFGFMVLGVVTLAEIWSLYLLLWSLPAHTLTPGHLLRSAGALWLSNVIVFALWYWRLDAGGPHERDRIPGHTDGAFLFPQMTMTDDPSRLPGTPLWSPHFLDYLFLAWNHSTAFSPTDVAVLSRWAKVLVMVQSSISFVTVALLAARAINIIQ